jgi:hypothetical protein
MVQPICFILLVHLFILILCPSVYFYPLSALIPNIMGGHLLFRVTRFDSCVMPWFPFGQGGLTSLVLNVCWGSSMCVSLLM